MLSLVCSVWLYGWLLVPERIVGTALLVRQGQPALFSVREFDPVGREAVSKVPATGLPAVGERLLYAQMHAQKHAQNQNWQRWHE